MTQVKVQVFIKINEIFQILEWVLIAYFKSKITHKLCWWIIAERHTYKVDSILVTFCSKKRSTTNKKSSEYLSFLLSSPSIKHLVSLKCNDFLGNIIDIAHNPNCNSHPDRSSRVRKTKNPSI